MHAQEDEPLATLSCPGVLAFLAPQLATASRSPPQLPPSLQVTLTFAV